MIELLHIDCMEYMATLPDKAFDLAIVDPPYGLGDKLTIGGTWANKYKKGDAGWDVAPNSDYFSELFRVSKNQIIWGANYFSLPATRCFLIWDKVALMDTMADCEFAWTSFDKNAKIFRHVRNTSETRIHICQKPVKLYKWILENYATCKKCKNAGFYWTEITHPTHDNSRKVDCDCGGSKKILDTHLGSGSSAIAAHKMGFDFVGCELDKDYYDAACKRFKEQTMQLSLI